MKIDNAYLRIIYEYLQMTVMSPLGLAVPVEWLVYFNITKDPDAYGWANPEGEHDDPFCEYTMDVSKVKNKTYKDVLETLLHEMVHIHLHYTGVKNWDEHSKAFDKVQRRIEEFTGFSISQETINVLDSISGICSHCGRCKIK